MLPEQSDSGAPTAQQPTAETEDTAAAEAAQPMADFVDSWLASRSCDGTHDPALVALVVDHRKKDSIAEPALLKALGSYARLLSVELSASPAPLPSAAPESE
jgi:hypothetical protein